MHLTRWLLIACAGWVLAAGSAQALSLGQPPARVIMGSVLNMAWPLRLDPNELFEPECASAELQVGERRVPTHKLRWWVEPGKAPNERVLRVISLVVIDEPVVAVQVFAGCTARVSRRFTTLAEPPLLGAITPEADQALSDMPAVAALPPTLAALAASQLAFAAGSGRPAAATASAASAASSSPAASVPQRHVPVKPPRSTAQSVQAAAPQSEQAGSATPPAARLSLDAPDFDAIRRALATALAEQRAGTAQDVALIAESASAAAASAQAAADGAKALEERVTRLLAENQQQREQMQQLRQRASRGEAASRWIPWLLAALLLCLATAAWLAMKLRRQQREAQSKWWADAADVLADARRDPPPSRPASPDQTDEAAALAGNAAKPQAWPPAASGLAAAMAGAGPQLQHAVPAAIESAIQESIQPSIQPSIQSALPASITAPDTALNPVTVQPDSTPTIPPQRTPDIEDLIDLEQQAEFFVVLGQDDSAIDLLMSHLRESGGVSPLPYLKLLEIYRRRGEREAYDRIRNRFNQRFNGYAPEWETDMLQGRTLIDYPRVILRLQRAWPSPIDAMAELETLMFRKDGGELFELPAYREVLMLYSLARSLQDQQANRQADVDVLLPLSIDDSVRVERLLAAWSTSGETDDASQGHGVDLDLGAQR